MSIETTTRKVTFADKIVEKITSFTASLPSVKEQKAKDEELLDAINSNDVRRAQIAIRNGGNLNMCDEEGNNLLYLAIDADRTGNVPYLVQFLIDNGIDNSQAMNYAINLRNGNITDYLSKNGFDIKNYVNDILKEQGLRKYTEVSEYENDLYQRFIKKTTKYLQPISRINYLEELYNKNFFEGKEALFLEFAIKDLAYYKCGIEVDRKNAQKDDNYIIGKLIDKIKNTPDGEKLAILAASCGEKKIMKLLSNKYDPTKILNAALNSEEEVTSKNLFPVIKTAILEGAKYNPDEILEYAIRRGDKFALDFAIKNGVDIDKDDNSILFKAFDIKTPYYVLTDKRIDILSSIVNEVDINNKGENILFKLYEARKEAIKMEEWKKVNGYAEIFSNIADKINKVPDEIANQADIDGDTTILKIRDGVDIKNGKGITYVFAEKRIIEETSEELAKLINTPDNESLSRQLEGQPKEQPEIKPSHFNDAQIAEQNSIE